jgi:mono/diheme cytochrome c family protein
VIASDKAVNLEPTANETLGPIAAAVIITASMGAALYWLYFDRATSVGQCPNLREARRIAAGKSGYGIYCASCHGSNLEGQPNWTTRLPNGRMPAPPHDDSGHTWHHSNEVLFALTKYGMKPPYAPVGYASDMPAFARTLSDDDIWNVLAFIQSRWSDQVRARHDRLQHGDQHP